MWIHESRNFALSQAIGFTLEISQLGLFSRSKKKSPQLGFHCSKRYILTIPKALCNNSVCYSPPEHLLYSDTAYFTPSWDKTHHKGFFLSEHEFKTKKSIVCYIRYLYKEWWCDSKLKLYFCYFPVLYSQVDVLSLSCLTAVSTVISSCRWNLSLILCIYTIECRKNWASRRLR